MIIRQHFNETFAPVFHTKARYNLLWGGRGRGASHFATDYFLHLQTQPHYFRGFFMRENFNDIRASLWQDYKDRIETIKSSIGGAILLSENSMSARNYLNGNMISSKGFKKSSGKQTAKTKSLAGATHVLVEEMEEISEADFMQLDDSFRTTKSDIKIMGLFNPPHRNHWIIKRWFHLQDAAPVYGPDFKDYYIGTPRQDSGLLALHSTYRDNLKNINPDTRRNYELYRELNFEHYATVICGLISEGIRGVIYKHFRPCTVREFLELPYPSFFGLDFGFSEDPAALCEVKKHNDTIWVRQLFYEKYLTNPVISERLHGLGIPRNAEIIADSAEPKSIQELRDYGWHVTPAVKGADSVRSGINYIKGKQVFYTEDSKDIEFEKNNYKWRIDPITKEPTDEPIDKHDHQLDALRYVCNTKYNTVSDAIYLLGSGVTVK